jgi:hypothetical protein
MIKETPITKNTFAKELNHPHVPILQQEDPPKEHDSFSKYIF